MNRSSFCYWRTTAADPAAAKAPDLIGRDVTAIEPNTKDVGDITYPSLEGGRHLYLATVIDLASRRLADWAVTDHMHTDLVTGAPAFAERSRGSLAGTVLRTDHGAQHTSRAFADACCRPGIRQSMSAIGSSADNALTQSSNATFERVTLQGRNYWSGEREARLDTFRHSTRPQAATTLQSTPTPSTRLARRRPPCATPDQRP